MSCNKFNDIAPFEDSEVRKTIEELLIDEGFKHAVRYVIPDVDWDEFSVGMLKYETKQDFQSQIISQTIWAIAHKTAGEVTSGGWEKLDNESHIFISNHRDIVLDAGLLNVLLIKHGFSTTEIAIGDNLLIHPWIEKLVRLNKSFLVKRGVTGRQILEASVHLSEYIHYAISQKHESIWLAQREGRAKDSNDRTQESVLKMLAMSPEKTSFTQSLKELNIVPLAISYEYDPCDYLKAKEFQLKRDNPEYKKTQRDDLLNMEIGLLGYKGNVHFQFCQSINDRIDNFATLDRKAQPCGVAQLIDSEIHANYKFFACNYIAYDLLEKTNRFADKYTQQEASKFEDYLNKQIGKIDLENKDIEFLKTKIFEMYSNALRNYLTAKGE